MSLTLKSATELALAVVKRKTAARKIAYPFQSNVSQPLQKGYVGVYDRWIVEFESPQPDLIRASMRDIDLHRADCLTFEAHSEVELSQRIEAWCEKIVWWADRLSVIRLQSGKIYRVLQPFKDYYEGHFAPGTLLTYVGQNFLPYEGGYTITFQQATMYLQETENAQILTDFDAYLELDQGS